MFCEVGSLGTGGTGLRCGSRICSMAFSSSSFVAWKPLIDVVSTLNRVLEPCGWSLCSVVVVEFFDIESPWFLATRKNKENIAMNPIESLINRASFMMNSRGFWNFHTLDQMFGKFSWKPGKLFKRFGTRSSKYQEKNNKFLYKLEFCWSFRNL